MPIRLKRRKSHSRPAYPSGLEIRRGPDITAKIDGELKHTESASGDSGLQDHQQHEVTEEFDVNTGFTGLVPGDRAPQSRQQQEASAEININVGESGYASRARAPQASQNENTAAAPDIPAFSSIFYDSRYLGSETRVKPQKWLNPLSSIGKLILTIQGHNIWEAEGPAQEAFHKLDPVIGDYLTTHMTTTSRPLYRLFMTGQTADTARPTILFYFINANLRKDARSIRRAVKRSGILDRYPGFKIDQSSRPNKYTRLFPEAEFILPQTHPHDGEIESQPSSPMFPGWQSELGRSSSLDSISQRQRNTSPPEVHEVEHMFEEVLTSDSSFSQESLTDQTHHVSEETVSKLTQITRWFTDKIWPTPQGSQRLWYLCVSFKSVPRIRVTRQKRLRRLFSVQGCGRHTYIDVKEIEPGGVESVRQNIMKNAAAVRSRPNHPQGAHESSSPLATPSPVHPVSSSTRTSPRIGSTQTRATALPSLPTAPLMNTVTSSSAPPQDMHLLVCVAAREFQTLAKVRHVDIAHDWNDGMLLRALLREYEEARRGQQWSISSLLPALPAKLGGLLVFRFPFAERTLSGIRDSSIWDVWRNLVPDGGLWAPLHMPSTADFVKVN